MKIPASIRRSYEDQSEANRRLKAEIDRLIGNLKDRRWHYESRLKEIDSFALKAESGQFHDGSNLEDFFACTLVVPNILDVMTAENLITDTFTLRSRRPAQVARTHKRPDAFPFDDLRLYIRLKEDPTLPPNRPPNDLVGIIFEAQVKTFLQHAWSIATHDLVYKSDDATWGKERIAYQIKAMLEHAELSIHEAERLAASEAIAKEDNVTTDLRASIRLLKDQWADDDLPKDVRRLAENVTTLRRALGIGSNDLKSVLNAGKATRGNTHPLNLSPYGVIVQYLIENAREKITELLVAANSRVKVLIPPEIDLPADFDRAACRNAIFLT